MGGIKREARICADPAAHRIEKNMAGTALSVGVGLATGVGFDPNAKKVSQADLAKAKMVAYNRRIVELGGPPADISAEIAAAQAERNPPEVTAASDPAVSAP